MGRENDCFCSGHQVHVAYRKALESRDGVYVSRKGQVCLLSSVVEEMPSSRVSSPEHAPLHAVSSVTDFLFIIPWELGLREQAQMLTPWFLPLL